MDHNGLVEAIAQSDTFRRYESAFTELTGLPIALRPAASKRLPFRGKDSENKFCSLMASGTLTCNACLLAQETLLQKARLGSVVLSCRHGLSEAAIPIRIGEDTVAFLRTGQVLGRVPEVENIEKFKREYHELEQRVASKSLVEAYKRTPVVESKRMQSIVTLLETFAQLLKDEMNRLATMDAYQEPQLVARAKGYVRSHASEQLSLHTVAKAISASAFHLCKLFKASTGLHFTEYISRVRVEKARDLLLRQNLRISEVAYEAGFQSITHFNRMFRRITGTSPTEYRKQLRRWKSHLMGTGDRAEQE